MVTTNTQLTERDLARYVGTGVKVRSGVNTYTLVGNSVGTNIFAMTMSMYNVLSNDDCKLILRPLSDLTKPCLEGGKVPVVELFKRKYKNDAKFKGDVNNANELKYQLKNMVADCWLSNNGIIYYRLTIELYNISGNPHWIIEQLHLWHFDTGLDKNLWIDINTLEVKNGTS